MTKTKIDPVALENVAKHEFELQKQVFHALGWVPHTVREYSVEGSTFSAAWQTHWLNNPDNKGEKLYVTWTPEMVLVESIQGESEDLGADPEGRPVPCVTVMVCTENERGMLVCPINGMTLQCGVFEFPVKEVHEHETPRKMQ